MSMAREVLKWLTLVPLVGLLSVAAENATDLDPARDQIALYKLRNQNATPHMTLSNGAPVEIGDTSTLNQRLIYNNYFMESMSGLVRERIPLRPVHAKGSGAFGYFVVTNNVTQYTKADFLSEIGLNTPVAVRFSPATIDSGISDSSRLFRGFAVKFYTRQGNFDIVGITVPILLMRDPAKFASFTHTGSRNPSTHLLDNNAKWDFITGNPESFFMFSKIFSNEGITKGYRHATGYGVHTFQVQNKFGEIYLVRFYFIPDAGAASLTSEEASKLNIEDPDSFGRDLYEAIACGRNVSWTFSMQVMTVDEANNMDFDVYDITQEIPFDKVPLTEIGKLVLDRNPDNFFAQVEQAAYCPCNLVPGIDGGVDIAFQARMFAYRDAQIYRLGVNHNKIEVNCPYRADPHNNYRDGVSPVGENGKDSPHYYKTSFNGPEPYEDKYRSKLIEITEKEPNNYAQVCANYKAMSDEEKTSHNQNIVTDLGTVLPSLQEKAIKMMYEICPAMAEEIQKGLKTVEREAACNVRFD